MRLLEEADVSGKKVILRADLDVPLRQKAKGKSQEVADDTRLKALLPTLKYLLRKKASVLIIGHLGRPEGKNPALSLYPVFSHLRELLGKEIKFLEDYQPPATDYQLAMLENLRFWVDEEKNDPDFSRRLASLGDLYINDAFAASHRKHASIAGISKHLPSYAGLQLEKEVRELGEILEKPARPLVFILGGAKVETKKPLVHLFAKIADKILLGGLLMFSQELEGVPNAVFPVDAKDVYDIGPRSIKLFLGAIEGAKTVVWNGPLGKWEESKYEKSTRVVAEALAKSRARTIVGGGDTIAALNAFSLLKEMSYVSLGGGAMLEFLAGKKLPGLEVLGHYRR